MSGRVHEFSAVVLADVEGVDSHGFGKDRLLDGVADRLVAADRAPRLIDRYRQKRVEAKFEVLRGFVISS